MSPIDAALASAGLTVDDIPPRHGWSGLSAWCGADAPWPVMQARPDEPVTCPECRAVHDGRWAANLRRALADAAQPMEPMALGTVPSNWRPRSAMWLWMLRRLTGARIPARARRA